MFGDIGHGAVLLLAGTLMCLLNSCLSPRLPSLSGAFRMRYLILLLGVFATFTGVVYNDMMSIPLYTFNSCYDKHTGTKLAYPSKSNSTKLVTDECIYPLGVDPVWYTAKNELQFMNSLKMKMAVILGVL